MPLSPEDRCPCGSGDTLFSCCDRFINGESWAPTAERLMRSRFTAFAMRAAPYLLATWHPRTRPTTLDLDASRRWYRLDILSTTRGGPFDTHGTVLFEAFFRDESGNGSQLEKSNFVREQGRWLYVDGV